MSEYKSIRKRLEECKRHSHAMLTLANAEHETWWAQSALFSVAVALAALHVILDHDPGEGLHHLAALERECSSPSTEKGEGHGG